MNRQSLMKWDSIWVIDYQTRYILLFMPNMFARDTSQILILISGSKQSQNNRAYSFRAHTNRGNFDTQNAVKFIE